MNFKNISLIIPLLCVGLKVIAGPVEKETVDLSVENESDDEIFSLGEEVDLNDDNAKFADIFSDEEFMATEVIEEDEECSSEECIQISKKLLGSMDFSANPCDDFYQFTCGGRKSGGSSEEENSNDIFTEVALKTSDELRKIFENEYVPNEQLSKEDQAYDEKTFKKLKATYDVCMNEVNNETYPNEYFINYIKSFNITENQENLKDAEVLTNLFYKLRTHIVNPFIDISPMIEESISNEAAVSVRYSIDDLLDSLFFTILERNPENKETYKNYMKTVLTTIHGNETGLIDTMIESIFKTEIKLSTIFRENKLYSALVELNQSVTKKVEVYKLKELNEKYPFIQWDSYIKRIYEYFNLGEFVNVNDDMIIYNALPIYLEELNKLLEEMTEEDIIYYLEWKLESSVLLLLSRNDHISEELVKMTYEMDDMMNDIMNSLSLEEINELMGYDFSDIYNLLDMEDDDTNELSSNAIKSLFMNKFKNTLNSLHKRNGGNIEMGEGSEEGNEEGNEEGYDEGNEEDRHDICFSRVASIMNMAISKFFIDMNFSKNTREEAKEMVENIKEMMMDRIPKMEWLDDDTSPHAIEKVVKMKDRIGYPDEAMNSKKIYQRYQDIEIDNMFDLVIEGNAIAYGNSLRRSLDKNEWQMDAYTVNAYYDLYDNSINFPAALFQSPFYESNGQDYINYATVGSIIGHELTHAFDNTGRLFDAEGHFNNWWSDNDVEEFNEYSQCFIDEYNSITYNVDNKKTINVNGEKTLGENLADNGGLARAYDAWKYSLLKNPEKAATRNLKLPGFENYTIDQLFYIAYGYSYCLPNSILYAIDVHSPGIARVNGVVANSKHFAKTFNCPTNSPMNPENKCLIW